MASPHPPTARRPWIAYTLAASGLLQLALALSLRLREPTADCRLYGDCAGEAMTRWLVTGPLAVLGISNLVLAAARPDVGWQLRLVWLLLSWAYAAYWLVPLLY